MKSTNLKRKRTRRILLASILLLLVLFVPLPMGQMKDGGTKVYRALTYKVVRWNRLYIEWGEQTDDGTSVAFEGTYRKTVVYWLADASRSDAELWQQEKESPDFREYLISD